MALALLDKSAWARGGSELIEHGELCICAITKVEILCSARSGDDYVTLEGDLKAYRDLRVDHATLAAAQSAQRELAATGRHRVPIPDLIIGACAQQHGADILHVDRHFDLLAEVLNFQSIRVTAQS